MLLTIGKKTNKDLAEWFGIKEVTFRQAKTQKLEELKSFAKFHEEKGKVIIEEVLIPEYIKKKDRTYATIKENFDSTWSEDGLDSCSRVTEEMKEILQQQNINIADSTVYSLTRQARNDLYGKPMAFCGSRGSCAYELCKKYGDGIDAIYKHFTPEEIKIKDDIIKKHFGNTTEKQIIVRQMVQRGELTKEEAWETLQALTGMDKEDNFLSFLTDLEQAFGCQIVRGTMIKRGFELPCADDLV